MIDFINKHSSYPHGEFILGIDAGGTSTRCLIVNQRGQLVARGRGGPGNTNFVSAASARRSLEQALAAALKLSDGHAAVAVIAGPHLPQDAPEIVARYCAAERILVSNEFEVGLAAGLCKARAWGTLIMSGTGSFCRARNAHGREGYSGGWGPLIGDEGSGYDIAREALIAVARASDGRGDATMLSDILLAELGITGIGELRRILYKPPIKRHAVASLAEAVSRAAAKGDKTAGEILALAGLRLAALAAPVITALFAPNERFPVVLSGGILRGEPLVGAAAATEIRRIRPGADISLSTLEPIAGTAIIGLDAMGIETGPGIISNLKKAQT